jgi:hypothetical protein
MGLFDGAGKAAGVSAVETVIKKIQGADLNAIVLAGAKKIKGVNIAEATMHAPIIGDLVGLYSGFKMGLDSMTPEQKAEFYKNLMIAGAKLAAKAA